MGLLDSNRFLPVGYSQLTANESVSLATANTAVKTIPAKKGFNCVEIILETSSPTAALCVRVGSTTVTKLLVTNDGELHGRIDYYNNLSYLGGGQKKHYYILTDGSEELRLFNLTAVSGGTATITVNYLQEFPSFLDTLKPRQVLYRKTKTFTSSDKQFNETLQTAIKDSEVYFLLRYFKYLAVEMIFLNSSNAKKSVSGTFKLKSMFYLPLETNNPAAPYYSPDVYIIDTAISSQDAFSTGWVEVQGQGLRYETNLGQTVSDGDKVIMNIIGIR